MKLTLDHNVVIDLANRSENVNRFRQALVDGHHKAYVVEIGASEMRKRGIRPERFDLFEELLGEAGIFALPRLLPMMVWDVTFWDHSLWSDDEMSEQASAVEAVLFAKSPRIEIAGEPEHTAKFAAWINRICDVQTMWCHLRSGNDVFVTSDRNFFKSTKLPRLLEMGAGRIARPADI